MNLNKLFEIQSGLDHHIVKEKGLEGQDLLDKKILALQVELGELANEWRGFKFWSKDQKARTETQCHACEGKGFFDFATPFSNEHFTGEYGYCEGTGIQENRNPLLEEYVDCLHFTLSIGITLKIKPNRIAELHQLKKMPNVTDQFLWTNKKLLELYVNVRDGNGSYSELFYLFLFNAVVGLGGLLGFTWKQIEQAYLDKNKINHERQLNGY